MPFVPTIANATQKAAGDRDSLLHVSIIRLSFTPSRFCHCPTYLNIYMFIAANPLVKKKYGIVDNLVFNMSN